MLHSKDFPPSSKDPGFKKYLQLFGMVYIEFYNFVWLGFFFFRIPSNFEVRVKTKLDTPVNNPAQGLSGLFPYSQVVLRHPAGARVQILWIVGSVLDRACVVCGFDRQLSCRGGLL
jgi:hypothetical protein